MTDVHLTQAEADELLAMEKRKVDNRDYNFPVRGDSLAIRLISSDAREHFLLDLYRGKANRLKVSYQNRARSVVVLARLDIGGAPHRNPDGTKIVCPHLHLYSEDFGDKYAVSPPAHFSDLANAWTTLHDFILFCNIVVPPKIQRGLFI